MSEFKPLVQYSAARPLSLFDRMWNDQRGLCCYCERLMKHRNTCDPTHPLRATNEHLKRTADGGTNDAGNRRLACLECNSGRGSVDWLTYKSYKMGELTCV